MTRKEDFITFTSLGKENYQEIRLHPNTYKRLETFCSKKNFQTWSGAIDYLLSKVFP